MSDIGKMFMLAGGLLFLVGALIVIGGRAHLPVGRFPGDIVYRGRNSTVYFPVVTCVVLSIVLSFALWLLGRLGR